jgi:hypothetical protein
MKSPLQLQLIREIAKERKRPVEEVMLIVNSQSAFAREVIQKSGFDSVKLPYIGKFYVKLSRVHKLSEKKAKEREINGTVNTR